MGGIGLDFDGDDSEDDYDNDYGNDYDNSLGGLFRTGWWRNHPFPRLEH